MPKKIPTNLFLNGVLLGGAAAFIAAAAHLTIAEPVKFACYCALAVIAATLKVRLPGVTGTLSVIHVFVLIGLADLSLPECLIAGTFATVVQCLAQSRSKPRHLQVLFNVANIAIAIVASGAVFSSSWLLSHHTGLLLRLTFASITYFILNTFAVTAIISMAEGKAFLRVWRECYLWVFPFFFTGAMLAWDFHWLTGRFGWPRAMLALPAIYILYTAYHLYLGRLRSEKQHAQDLAELHLRTIEALALAIDAKDHSTHDDLQRLNVYATGIARELRLTELEMEALEAAVMLHDIGKLAVPEHIISKPGKLTPEEFEKIKIHPVVGAEILERVRFPYPVADVVRAHHEKWDGSGYPLGLEGEAIPIGARILAVVDCLIAVASDRQYRKGVPLDQAMAIVSELAGTAFDPAIVEILERRYRDFEVAAERNQIQVPAPALSTHDKQGFLASIAAARQEVQTLFELSDDLGQSIGETNTLSIFASKLKVMIPHDLLCIYSIAENTLVPDYVNGSEQLLYSSLRIPVGQGLAGWVAQNNLPVVNGNPAAEPGYLNDPMVITNLKSVLAIPLEEEGRAIGVLSLYSRERSAFSRDHLRILQALGPRLGAVLSNGRRLSEAQDNAVTDFLTGLPNARSLYVHLDAEMSRCRRKAACMGVFLCDLDGFKRVNDEHGHVEGNRVLKAVGAVLRECCRGYDYVARMGGDEFVVLAPDIKQAAIHEKIRRLRDAVEMTGIRLGHPGLSLSVGAVAFVPGEADVDADAILTEADRNMYADKCRLRPHAADPAVAMSV